MKISVIGNLSQRRSLASLVAHERVPSGVILSGPDGIGKSLIARKLAKLLLCLSEEAQSGTAEDSPLTACGYCSNCLLLENGEHPDFYQIDARAPEVNLASVRAMIGRLNLVPFYGGSRVVILDHAEQLTTQAFQLLLKPIEESQPNTFFIIVTSSLVKIPITIRSRCQIFGFSGLSKEELKEVVTREVAVDRLLDGWEQILEIADGRVSTTLALIDQLEKWDWVKQTFRALRRGGFSPVLDLSDYLSKSGEELSTRLALLRLFAREAMRRSRSGESKRAWSVLLTNLIQSERLIIDRRIPIEQVTVQLFNGFQSSLIGQSSPNLIQNFDAHLG